MKKKYSVSKTAKELAKALGLTPADALEWEVRYAISQKIIKSVKKTKITITDLAKSSGTSRARITRILKGDSLGISIDVLLRVLGACGQTIKLSFKKAS
jgi:transcriptional regulator with XRE-family HTH domain